MTDNRVSLTLTIATDLDPQTVLDGFRVMLTVAPSPGRLESAIAAALPDGSAAVIVQGESEYLDGVYASPEIETNCSDTDNPFLRAWLEPDDDYEYRLPAATWKAES